MSTFGLRSSIKSGLKRLLGQSEPVAATPSPPPAAAAPAPAPAAAAPAPAAAAPAAAPPAAPAPAPVAAAPLAAAPAPAPAAAAPAPAAAAPPAAPAPAPAPVAAAPLAAAPADDVVGAPIAFDAVQAILDDMVRPALQGDGGDITLLKVEDNNIYVRLVGSCSTCPSSIMTMKMGVESLLREEFPAMRELIQVDAAPTAPA
jgi:Fe-S cluster biogenesis protein NfuA